MDPENWLFVEKKNKKKKNKKKKKAFQVKVVKHCFHCVHPLRSASKRRYPAWKVSFDPRGIYISITLITDDTPTTSQKKINNVVDVFHVQFATHI